MPFPTKDNIERIKYIVEILAIIIGGWWAWKNFSKVTEPTLAIRGKTESTLKWEKPAGQDYIHADFYVTMENTGTSIFKIHKVKLRGWFFDEAQPTSMDTPIYRDVNQIISGHTPFLDTTYVKQKVNDPKLTGPPFLGNYMQNSVWAENFEFVMLKPQTKRLVLFLIQFYNHKRDSTAFDWTYHWGYVGGLDSSEIK